MNAKLIGERIKKILKYKGVKRIYLAKMMGISYNTLTNKLNGKSEFSALEIAKVKQILELNDELSINIFFNPNFKITDIYEMNK